MDFSSVNIYMISMTYVHSKVTAVLYIHYDTYIPQLTELYLTYDCKHTYTMAAYVQDLCYIIEWATSLSAPDLCWYFTLQRSQLEVNSSKI
jgi:hypothetical protein